MWMIYGNAAPKGAGPSQRFFSLVWNSVSEHKNREKEAPPMLTYRHPKEEEAIFPTMGKTQRGEVGGSEAA